MPSPHLTSFYSDHGYQELMRSVTAEFITNHALPGFLVPFLNREDAGNDTFGDVQLRRYGTAVPLDFYLTSSDSFGGENELFSRFGLEIRDQVSLSVSRSEWDAAFANGVLQTARPVEGDIVAFAIGANLDANGSSHTQYSLFELRNTNQDELFYQFGTLTYYELTCDRYEFNNDLFKTGIPQIDALSENNTLVSEEDSSGTVDFDNNNPFVADPSAMNKLFEDETQNILDLSERNPFEAF